MHQNARTSTSFGTFGTPIPPFPFAHSVCFCRPTRSSVPPTEEAVSWDLAEEATRDAAPELRKKGNDLFEAEDYETRKMGGCQDQMDQE